MEVDMKKVAVVFALLACLPLVSVSQVSSPALVANVNFAFYADGKLLPAGSYEFRPTRGNTAKTLDIVDTKTKQTWSVPILTSISKKQASEGGVVFDQAENKNYLSEVYIPGMDGILLKGAPTKHVHVVIEARK
jgi:hypothetical protein